jgi:hypothetical protein
MSERELNRVEVLAQVDDGRLTVDNAANMLELTRRQIFRLLRRYRQDVRPVRLCPPSHHLMTFLICRRGDISTWLQHRKPAGTF